LYRKILGLIGARFSTAPTGRKGLCSNADKDALELNAAPDSGGDCSCEDEDELDSVIVAIEVPLD
jgi:hypothetical protein